MSATRSSPSVPRGASGRSSIHADRPKYRQSQPTSTSKATQPQPAQTPVVPPLRGLPVVASPTLSPRDPRDAPRVRRAVAPSTTSTAAEVDASDEDEDEETEAEIGLQMRQRVYSSASASPMPSPDRSNHGSSIPAGFSPPATPLELLQAERARKTKHVLSPASRRKFDSLQQELAELSEASPRASPVASDDEDGTDVQVDLHPIDTTRLALEAEIARLQKLVQQPSGPQTSSSIEAPTSNAYVQEAMAGARVEAAAVSSAVLATSSSSSIMNGTSTRHRTPSSSSAPSPSLQASRSPALTPSHRPQYSSRARARQRVLAREETLKEYLFNTARLWSLLLLRAALIQLEAVRGSRAVRSLLSLPFVRGLITTGCDISLSVISTILHSKLFRFLPFSELIRNILLDESLHKAWKQLTPMPDVQVLPLTQGPLRPVFQIASYFPFSSWFFTLDPPLLAIQDEASVEEEDRQRDRRRSSKSLLPAAPASDSSAASSSSSYDSTASIAASSPSPVTSLVSESASPLPSSHPFFTELLTRLESQAALIAFLQQDRQSLRSTIDTMREQQDQLLSDMDTLAWEKKQLEQRNEATATATTAAAVHPNGMRNRKSNASVQLEMSAPIECIHIPSTKPTNTETQQPTVAAVQIAAEEASPSNSSSFLSAAASAQLNALQLENIELRGLASAQESSVAAQEAVIQAMTEEAEVLAERIYELEEALTDEKKRNGTYVPPPHDVQ